MNRYDLISPRERKDKWASYILNRSKTVESGCWEWFRSRSQSGYGQGHIDGQRYRAHRLSYLAFVGEIPDGLHVLHLCHNRACVNPNHLKLGTHQENMRDRAQAGRNYIMQGVVNPKAKLDPEKVKLIRSSGKSGGALAQQLGVSRALVNMVRRNEIWRHV